MHYHSAVQSLAEPILCRIELLTAKYTQEVALFDRPVLEVLVMCTHLTLTLLHVKCCF